MKNALFLFLILGSINVHADVLLPLGLQCSGLESSDLKNCLKKESSKIDEANRPNEIILQSHSNGKESLIKLVNDFAGKRSDPYALELLSKIPLIESSVATALIVQYEDEPQLYYYIVDKDGKLEVIFDGINSVDLTTNFPETFRNETDLFYLKSNSISKEFLEWIDYLKAEENL